MGSGVKVEFKLGDGPLKRHMAALAKLNTHGLVVDIAEYLLERVHENFEGEKNPDGTPWPKRKKPAAPTNADGTAQESTEANDGKLLQAGGHLRDSYVYNMISDTAAEIGSGMIYAAIHHFGGKTKAHVIEAKNGKALKTPYGNFKRVKHPGSDIPARVVLGVGAQDEAEIDAIAMRFLAENAA